MRICLLVDNASGTTAVHMETHFRRPLVFEEFLSPAPQKKPGVSSYGTQLGAHGGVLKDAATIPIGRGVGICS